MLIIYNTNSITIMGMTYIADELIFRIREAGQDKTKFIREAIEEKLSRKLGGDEYSN